MNDLIGSLVKTTMSSSGVWVNLGKKITGTLDSAQKDFRQQVAKSLSVAASSIATTQQSKAPGTKTKLFTSILDRSQSFYQIINDKRVPKMVEGAPPAGISTEKDGVQEKLAAFARLEKEFSELLEAYEILVMERIHLEETVTGSSQLESLDDLELVGQYFKSLQDNAQISKTEIFRLTSEVDRLNNTAMTKEIKEYEEIPPDVEPNTKSEKASSIHEKENNWQEIAESKSFQVEKLKDQVDNLSKEKNKFTISLSEQQQFITSLESQKIALETKVSFMQKQLLDFENFKGRLAQASTANQQELQELKASLDCCKLKLQVAETESLERERELEAARIELDILKEQESSGLGVLLTENRRLELLLSAADKRLLEERRKYQELIQEISECKKQIDQVRQELELKENEIIKCRTRSFSIESVTRPSIPESPVSLQRSTTKPNFNDHENLGNAASMKALKAECERLALENSRIKKSHSNSEYIRNLVLRFLQLPDQRHTLVPVLANILNFSKEELSSCHK